MKIKKIRYNRKKVFIFLFLFLFLLGIGIGFAYVNTSLEITGIAKVKDAKWGIQLNNYTLTDGSVTPNADPTITDTTISFAAKVNEPGEFYGFSIDVENNGTINASIANFSVTPDFSTINYLDASFTYEDGTPVQNGDLLIANTAKKIIVRLSYKDGIDESLYPTTDQSFNVVVSLNYEQYIGSVPWTLPQGKTKDNLTLGDELCLDDQCFNFIRYDGDDIVMLAKYNLKVGSIIDDNTESFYSKTDSGFGLQSKEVKGYAYGETVPKGVLPFSSTDYWDGTATYPIDVYDAVNYVTAPDFSTTCNNVNNCYKTPGYSIAYYVEQYKSMLATNYGKIIKRSRLLTLSEATDSSIGCTYVMENEGGYCPTTGDSSFITNTSFWLGTAVYSECILHVNLDDGYVSIDGGFDSALYGVRPIIVVEKSKL